MPYPKSDHFDGSHFSNYRNDVDKGFFDVLKWKIQGTATPWPDWVEIEKASPSPLLGKGEASTTFINHATHLIEIEGLRLLTDPVFSKRTSPVSWAGPVRVHRPAIEMNSLPQTHIVLISHNHYDHMDVDSISELSKKFDPLFIVPLGNKKLIQSMGAKKIIELDWWQETAIDKSDVRVTLVPAQHWSARGLFDRNKALWGGFVVQSPQLKIFFAGDTGYDSIFSDIRKKIGRMDLSILPIGAYEPRWFMKTQHMNPEDAVQAHIDLESRFSLGTHFGTFQLTDEGIDEPKKALKLALEEKKIDLTRFIAPKPGEIHIIKPAK